MDIKPNMVKVSNKGKNEKLLDFPGINISKDADGEFRISGEDPRVTI